MERWVGKTAVVTGANAGIGRAIVKDLVTAGIHVVAMGRNEQALQGLKAEFSSYKGKITPLKADLSKLEEVEEAVKNLKNNIGPIHVFVNNAAIAIFRDTTDLNPSEWKEQFMVNVVAPIIFINFMLKNYEENKLDEAQIVNISSIVAHKYVGVAGFGAYTATKTALQTAVTGMKLEISKKKINFKISSISPGYVKSTDLFRNQKVLYPEDAGTRDQVFHGITPTDISAAVKQILSHTPFTRVDDILLQHSYSSL